MRITARFIIVVVVAAVLGGVVWMFTGRVTTAWVVDNAQVLGALAGVAGVVVAVLALWPRRPQRAATEAVSGAQESAAIEYLATETLRYWRIQAKDRRITTPSPASVRWAWASEDVAVPAAELQLDPPATSRVLTAGVITQLRQQLYERLDRIPGRIVMLGGPGAGKTAAMLLLLIDILRHRPPGSDQPVPVWLTLGGWNPATSLTDWAAATLARDYPGLSAPVHGGPATAMELIRTGQVALFLDGLDEMAPAIQSQALQQIDRNAAGLNVVLTSRPTEYRTALADGRLYGAAVIEILPVDAQDAAAFLLAEQLDQRRHAWQQVTNSLRDHPNGVAGRTLTTPLALTLARDTYTHANPADLLNTDARPTPDALLQHLLARSLALAYPDPVERAHATRWLSWIAHHMGTNRDLRWWDISTWTPLWQRRLVFGLAVGLAFGLAVGLAGGLAGELAIGLAAGLAFGLATGLLFGLLSEPQTEPRALAARRPTSRELGATLLRGFALGLAAGLAFGLAGGLTVGLASGLANGLVFGFIKLLDVWSTPAATAQTVDPVEVYRSDRRYTIAVGLASGLAVGLASGLGGGLVFGLAVGLSFVFAVGLAFGHTHAVQLLMIQMIWWLQGRRVRLLPLFQSALHRQVLRQAGAVYQFRHAALQDFLAATASTDRGEVVPHDEPPPSNGGSLVE